MNRICTMIAAALLIAGAARAAPPAGPVVVELFTSQGCNSCPPADALLGELASRPDVLALALHITYWNDLGWRDAFSQRAFDERQRWYVDKLNLRSAYTPQMVVNGAQDVVGSQRAAVNRALDKAARPAAITLHNMNDVIEITLPALASACDCELMLFGIRPSASTPVRSGENGGRTLKEFQVVRVMQLLGKWQGDARVLQVAHARMPADASGFAVLAQQRWTGKVVAAGQ